MLHNLRGWLVMIFSFKALVEEITGDIDKGVFDFVLVFENPVIGILPKVQIKTIIYLIVVRKIVKVILRSTIINFP